MSVVNGSDPSGHALDMTRWGPGSLFDGSGLVTLYTSTEFIIGASSGTYHAHGFGLTYYVNPSTHVIYFTGGTVTSVEISASDGDQRYSISGFSKPIATFFDAFAGDTTHFLDAFFAGDDTINGTDLNDTLFGYSGNDSLYGGAGDDRLISDAGNNRLDGGAGIDTAVFRSATHGITVDLTLASPTVSTGLGVDTLVSIESVEGSDFADTFIAGAGTYSFKGFGGDDVFWLQGGGNYTVDGGDGNDVSHMEGAASAVVNGGNGDDIFYLQGAASVTADGGFGNDILYLQNTGTVSALGKTLYFGGSLDANDTVYGGTVYLDGDYSSHLTLSHTVGELFVLAGGHSYDLDFGNTFPSTGTFVVDGSGLSATDSLTLAGRPTIVYGGAGNDRVTNTSNLGATTIFHMEAGGDDTVIGGIANDSFYFGASLTAADVIDGGPNASYANWLYLDGDYSAGLVLNSKRISQIILSSGHSYNFTIGPQFTGLPISWAATQATSVIDGSALGPSDTLVVNAAVIPAQTTLGVIGGGGNDTLMGNGSLTGGAGNDHLIGGSALSGGDGNDLLEAGVGPGGNASLDGGAGNDTMIGGNGVNGFVGGDGDDLMVSHGTANYMTGGAGNDIFVFTALLDGAMQSVTDLAAGDRIDLTAIAGLSFIGQAAFSGVAGQLRYRKDSGLYGTDSVLEFDRNGDGIADASIRLGPNVDVGETAPGSRILTKVPDTFAPLLVNFAPNDGETYVSVHSGIALRFNETVARGSGVFEIHRADGTLFTTVPVTDTTRAQIDYLNFYIYPTIYPAGLEPNTSYYITFASGVLTDLAGNPYSGISSPTALNFTTAPLTDIDKPYVSGWSAAAKMPVDKNIVLTFTEPVVPGYGTVTLNGGGQTQTFSLSDPSLATFSGNRVTINFPTDLSYGTVYTFDAYGFKDFAGNFLGLDWYQNFSTGAAPESVPPVLLSSTPADDAQNVNVSFGTLSLTFDDVMAPGSGYITIHSANNLASYKIEANESRIGYIGNTLSIFSIPTLSSGTSYYVTIDPGALVDDNGNPFAGISSPTTLNFTTAGVPDTTAPTLSSIYPNDNSTTALPNTNVVLSFSERVAPGSGNVYIFRSDGTLLESASTNDPNFVVFDYYYNLVNVIVRPQFSPGASYYVMVDYGAFVDMAGNPFAGITTSTAFNFTTKAPTESTPPALFQIPNWNNATNVQLKSSDLTFRFNEVVMAGSGNFEIRRSADNSLFESIPVNDPSRVWFDTSSGFLYINPAADYEPLTQYYVVFPAGVVQDLSGNAFAGTPTPFTFTTVAAPAAADNTRPLLSSSTPGDNSRNIAVNTNIVLTFNEAVRAGAGNIEITRLDGSLFRSININDATQVSIASNVVTIDPGADLAPGTPYYVAIRSGVLEDLSGNAFSGLSTTALNFTTSGTPLQHDFNGDLKSDLLWQSDSGTPALWLLNGTGPAVTANVGPDPGSLWHIKGAGDFNGDGKSDILWQHNNGMAVIWNMDGLNLIGGGAAGVNPGTAWHVVGAADFNGDGKADILWRNDDVTPAIWLMNNTAIASGAALVNPGTAWHIVGTGDFNGDGKADILWQHDSGQAAIWLMDGTILSSGGGVGPNPGSAWHVKAAGDFNGDGKSDILWQHDDGTPVIWTMNGLNLVGGAIAGFNPGSAWHVIGTGDFNGDGKADIYWQNSNGMPAIWLMNGSSLIAGRAFSSPGSTWHMLAMGS